MRAIPLMIALLIAPMIALLIAHTPAWAEPPALDVNTATVDALRARLPARLVEPITKYRAFYKGRFESVEQVIEALSKVTFSTRGCGGEVECAERLTDGERGILRATLVVVPR